MRLGYAYAFAGVACGLAGLAIVEVLGGMPGLAAITVFSSIAVLGASIREARTQLSPCAPTATPLPADAYPTAGAIGAAPAATPER